MIDGDLRALSRCGCQALGAGRGDPLLHLPAGHRKDPVPTGRYAGAPTHNLNQAERWIEGELGAEAEIDEVRLLPVVPANFEVPGSEASPKILETGRASNLPGHPGQCGYILQTPGKRSPCLRRAGDGSSPAGTKSRLSATATPASLPLCEK